jgi:hypothetical protein
MEEDQTTAADAAKILAALEIALDDQSGLIWRDVDEPDAVLLAHATGTTAYDASYLWLLRHWAPISSLSMNDLRKPSIGCDSAGRSAGPQRINSR